jgi:ferrous-iron efflux pump FieF
MHIHHHERAELTQNAARISLLVGILLVAIQLYAYFMTNAMVVLASVLESVMDAIASATALFALHKAHRPADHNHRYGHGKAEPLVTMGQAAFVAGSGLYFFAESISRILRPEPIAHSGLGITIMIISSVMILVLLIYQHRVIRRTDSMSIKADFLHYVNDIVVNAVVIITLWLGTNLLWLDGAASVIIAIYVLWSAWNLAKTATGELMDKELDEESREAITAILTAHPAVSDIHDLRTRRSGPDVFIDAHIEMPGDMTLQAAHHVTDELESTLLQKFPNAHIILHQEPAGIDDPRLDEKIRKSVRP